MIMEWLLEGPWGWELVARGTNQWLESLDFEPYPDWPLSRGEGLEVVLITSGQWYNQSFTSSENTKPWGSGCVQVGHTEVLGSWHAACFALSISSIWLFLSYILYNKLVKLYIPGNQLRAVRNLIKWMSYIKLYNKTKSSFQTRPSL